MSKAADFMNKAHLRAVQAIGRRLAYQRLDRPGYDNVRPDFAGEGRANLVSSVTHRNPLTDGEDKHAPVLDLDIPAYLIPSSTQGHYHLYLDKEMTWEQYKRLLTVLAEVGILEKGYVSASIKRGATYVRVPGLKKEEKK